MASLQICVHGEVHICRQSVAKGKAVVRVILREANAVGSADCHDLAHHVQQKDSCLGIRANRAERCTQGCCGGGESHKEHEFLPDCTTDISADFCVDPAANAGIK